MPFGDQLNLAVFATLPKPLAQSQTAATESFRPGLDVMRFVAAFFIVWDHSFAPGWAYADPALSVFLILTAALSLHSYRRRAGSEFWRKRVWRLVLPWLFWCAAYRLMIDLTADSAETWRLLSDPSSLLIGPEIHLWFLPFCAIFLALVPLTSHLIKTRRALICACLGLGLVTVPLHAAHAASLWPEPFVQWSLALPLYAIGLLHAAAMHLGAQRITLSFAALSSALSMALWPQFWAAQMILGLVLFELAWRLPVTGAWAKRIGATAFGIYLMHPAFFLLGYKLWSMTLDPALAALARPDPIAVALFSFSSAFIAAEILRHLPYLRRTI